LPVHEVKIDKSFVRGMQTDSHDDVVRSIIDLGRNLGLQVVAEGVETEQAWQMLRGLGCQLAQGYHLSRPLPIAELDSWLRTRPGHARP
jgi:EAL domain-containing protein (putative c-di-GMP-specific phosphodiesterase class I)